MYGLLSCQRNHSMILVEESKSKFKEGDRDI